MGPDTLTQDERDLLAVLPVGATRARMVRDIDSPFGERKTRRLLFEMLKTRDVGFIYVGRHGEIGIQHQHYRAWYRAR